MTLTAMMTTLVVVRSGLSCCYYCAMINEVAPIGHAREVSVEARKGPLK